ncbi:hypothetical protein B0A50_03637 [Salinomyces thailandicus]|uniref:Uncharacterized protein n=1 Tax=Salinomyces thailandicus TaxID=706561 RepID=A0A4U0U2P1_9PEZI|nr:hypothetical protein B0A50_03637 [Salinomyces thailandica]
MTSSRPSQLDLLATLRTAFTSLQTTLTDTRAELHTAQRQNANSLPLDQVMKWQNSTDVFTTLLMRQLLEAKTEIETLGNQITGLENQLTAATAAHVAAASPSPATPAAPHCRTFHSPSPSPFPPPPPPSHNVEVVVDEATIIARARAVWYEEHVTAMRHFAAARDAELARFEEEGLKRGERHRLFVRALRASLEGEVRSAWRNAQGFWVRALRAEERLWEVEGRGRVGGGGGEGEGEGERDDGDDDDDVSAATAELGRVYVSGEGEEDEEDEDEGEHEEKRKQSEGTESESDYSDQQYYRSDGVSR